MRRCDWSEISFLFSTGFNLQLIGQTFSFARSQISETTSPEYYDSDCQLYSRFLLYLRAIDLVVAALPVLIVVFYTMPSLRYF